MYLNGGPLEKQRQLKSQPSLKIFNTNNNNNNNNNARLRLYQYLEVLRDLVILGYCISINFCTHLWGEWPSGPANSISFTEVKHGCVGSGTAWVTFQLKDENSSTVLRKER